MGFIRYNEGYQEGNIVNIVIITDDGADIPVSVAKSLDIQVLPIVINDGEKEYITNQSIDHDQIYRMMREGTFFSTSQVTAMTFHEAFMSAVQRGDTVIYVSLSSGISGTYSSAVLNANQVMSENPGSQIHVIDSLGATFGYGLPVIRIAKMAKEGCAIDEILEAMDFYRVHSDHLFTVGSLEYLYHGGRVSRASAALGGFLNIKPIMEVTYPEGKLEAIDKVRGKKALLKKMMEHLKMRCDHQTFPTDQTLAIVHGDWASMAEEVRDLMVDELNIPIEHIAMQRMGPVIGAHTGPEILAILFLNKAYNAYDLLLDVEGL